MTDFSVQEQSQRLHYDEITEDYECHYSDEWSQAYRSRFFLDPICQGIAWQGTTVLDAMCGTGQSVPYLLERGAVVTGLDISQQAIRSFHIKWPECGAIQSSIFETNIADSSFDRVLVVGGLHHLHPHLEAAIDEIYRILKPGGYLCFVEPHTASLANIARRLWYRFDGLFEKNEQAIDVDALQCENSHRFEFLETRYAGNVGYLFVLNSMVFRIPASWKKHYSPACFWIESVLNRVPGKRLSCFVACRWRKTM